MTRSMKLIAAILIVSLFVCAELFAWGGQGNTATTSSRFKTIIVENASGTAYLTSSISTDIIVPNINVILGYDVVKNDYTANAEMWATLYDGSPDAYNLNEILAEFEKDIYYVLPLWFPRPRVIENQLYIHQGPNTNVIIYFE